MLKTKDFNSYISKKLSKIAKDIISSDKVDENWFSSGTYNVNKVPIPIKHEVATQDGTVQTLEGKVDYKSGHHIITGPKGEKYPVSPAKFDSIYNDNKDGTATPKKIIKKAKLADHDGTIQTKWGKLDYKKGEHMIVRHGDNDYGPVRLDIFHQTYEKSE